MAVVDSHSYAVLEQGQIKHVNLDIAVELAARLMRIRADYQLDHPVDGPLHLDSSGQAITKIYSRSHPIEWKMDATEPIVGQRLRLMDLRGAQDFTIEFTTSPEASALQWLEPVQTAGGQHPFVYSQCQAIHARSLFPCQDSPGVRFTYEARVRVPNHLRAVMAAAPLGVEHEGDQDVYSFRMPQPIPAYLFAIAAGDLRFKEIGPRTGIYAEPSMLEAAAWEFEENERKIIEAEKLFGPYLWDRYDLLILPPSFPYGGMENPRLTFLTPTAVTGDRSTTTLISHELAHSWTGNLVTNATWDDFWLNEGWTSYAEARISEIVEGDEIARMTCIINHDLLKEDIQEYGWESPHTCLKDSLKGLNPDLMVSNVPYHKGRLFLTRLEQAVGRGAFDPFIHRYIATHQFGSLTTEGFVEFLRKELPAAVEKVDIETWIYQPGLPADCPVFTSKLYDDLMARIAAYAGGVLPAREEARNWHYVQKRMFLRLLPAKIPVEDCRKLEEIFGIEPGGNLRVVYEFYRLAIRSGYKEALPGIEEWVGRVGRHAFLTPLFRGMTETDWTRRLARPMFESVRPRHHPITVAAVEDVLKGAGV